MLLFLLFLLLAFLFSSERFNETINHSCTHNTAEFVSFRLGPFHFSLLILTWSFSFRPFPVSPWSALLFFFCPTSACV